MLAAWCDWAGDGTRLGDRIARSLGLFAGNAASFAIQGRLAFAFMSHPRAKPRKGWSPAEGASGIRVLFNGYLDNIAELVARLGLPPESSPGEVYAAALETWGDRVDLECVGIYCSLAVDRDADCLRLARSPYDAPPLHFYHDGGQAIVSSVPRTIFATGVEQRLNRRRVIRNLLFWHDGTHWFQGLHMVQLGSVVTITRKGCKARFYYDPLDHVRRHNVRENAPEEAFALLTESARIVRRSFDRPGMLLSGGLDSPLATLAVLETLPTGQRLPTFTFTPCAEWDGQLGNGMMGDERPLVEEFARQNPRIDPHFFANEGVGFDERWPEMFLATGCGAAGFPNYHMFHALWRTAAAEGCDGILSAAYGNMSYSMAANWTCAEYFRTGQWRQLAASMRMRCGDGRGTLRRFGALAIAPHTPLALRRAVRRARGMERTAYIRHNSALHPGLLDDPDAVGEDGRPLDPFVGFASRDKLECFAKAGLEEDMHEADIQQGFEQLYGIRCRDVTAYRPLIEFCLSLPTREFEWNGEGRRLARRMGIGRIPESIRANPLYGRHGVDWHARMAPRRAELIAEFEGYREDPELAGLLDLDRMIAVLRDWPEKTSYALDSIGPRQAAVTRAALAARFIRFVKGSNR